MDCIAFPQKACPLYVGITIENVIYFISFITLHGLPATEIFGIGFYITNTNIIHKLSITTE